MTFARPISHGFQTPGHRFLLHLWSETLVVKFFELLSYRLAMSKFVLRSAQHLHSVHRHPLLRRPVHWNLYLHRHGYFQMSMIHKSMNHLRMTHP